MRGANINTAKDFLSCKQTKGKKSLMLMFYRTEHKDSKPNYDAKRQRSMCVVWDKPSFLEKRGSDERLVWVCLLESVRF